MKTFITLICTFAVTLMCAKHKVVTLDNAAKSNMVKFKIRGTGTYNGDCLKFTLENKADDSLYVILPAGHRLDSKDNSEQDILITRDQFFVLGGYQRKEFKIAGFCCQASNHTPSKDSLYRLGKMADSNLVSLARYCNTNKFSISETQSAVWCISDKRPLASIPEANENLRLFVSKITKEEIPWYQIEYEKANSNTVISDRVERISGNINYDLTKEGMFRIELRDAKGHLMQNYTDKKPAQPGNHDYWFDMQVSNYPKGKYFIHFYNGKELVTKKQFEL